MTWNKPRTGWHWLLLATPALELMLAAFVADRWGSFLFPDVEIPELTFLFGNLFVALALSLALGLWLVWPNGDWSLRIGIGLACGITIAFVNFLIALGGCTLGNAIL
jgi:hypothetical protein